MTPYVVFNWYLRLIGKNKQEKMEKSEKEFEKIVREHKNTIYTVCFMFSKDNDEVNDLFQETLINLWQGFKTFRGDSSIRTWIWRVSLNTCISSERKKSKMQTVPLVPLSMDINLYEDTDDDSRQIQMLYNRINRLKPFDRAIILLWLDNLPYDEIAAIVGITVKNVSVRLVRIKEELKQMSNQ